MKYALIPKPVALLFFVFGTFKIGFAQKTNKGLVVELLNATETNSQRHFQYNQNQHWYFEGRVGYRFNKYFEASASVGYQLRNYLYFALFTQPFYEERLLFMERHYIPVAVNGRMYISDFFFEKLHLWKKQEKWDVYLQLSLAVNKGYDVPSPYEDELRALGATVPFYKWPYVHVYDRLQVSYVAGVRYNFNKHIGLFIEGGEGLLMNGVIGLRCQF